MNQRLYTEQILPLVTEWRKSKDRTLEEDNSSGRGTQNKYGNGIASPDPCFH